ncbi:MAG: P-II family nitrogen regulator [Pseudomonadota bacterium]
MQLVSAIIKPFKLDEVRDGLTELGVAGMTVAEVRGFGRQKGRTAIYRGAEYQTYFVPKLKVEVLVARDLVDQVVELIQRVAATGRIGDGKIFVTEVGHLVRIRTGEEDEEAL